VYQACGRILRDAANPGGLPIGPWVGLGVLAALITVALLVVGLVLQFRDAWTKCRPMASPVTLKAAGI
jgi:hypothetical protein